MEKERVIKITNALYKVANLFPKDEPLKFSIKKQGNLILSFFIILNEKNLVVSPEERKTFLIRLRRNIKILNGLFEIAKEQGEVNSRNFEILSSQYELLEKSLEKATLTETKTSKKEKTVKVKKAKKEEKEESGFKLSRTQEKLINVLQDNGKMRPAQINGFFPNKTARSIRRSLKDLKERGIVVVHGSGKTVLYEMNSYY